MADDPGGPLSDEELASLATLLARYAFHEMDQWDLWRIRGEGIDVYVSLSYHPVDAAADEAYRTIWPLPSHFRQQP